MYIFYNLEPVCCFPLSLFLFKAFPNYRRFLKPLKSCVQIVAKKKIAHNKQVLLPRGHIINFNFIELLYFHFH